MLSFLSKGIVIHTISSILGTRNLLHFNSKGIENYFCNCLRYCFFFFFSKARSASFTEMHVRLDGRFHFNSTLLKCRRRATTDRISKNLKPNQYTYAKNKNRVSVNCAVAKIYLIQIGMMNGYYRKKTFLRADPFFPLFHCELIFWRHILN